MKKEAFENIISDLENFPQEQLILELDSDSNKKAF
jgi:hypothetical protein